MNTEQKIDQCCEVTLQLAYSLVERVIDKHWKTIKQNDIDGIESYHADILPPFAEALKTLKTIKRTRTNNKSHVGPNSGYLLARNLHTQTSVRQKRRWSM